MNILSSLFALALVGSASGTVIYTTDFSVGGQGSTHDTGGSDPIEGSPIVGANWTLSFPSPSSDGTTNEFITVGGLMRVQDWGGDGTVTSNPITITGDGTVDIIGAALSIGSDSFNNVGTEGITWFYTLNTTTTTLYLGETELGGPVGAGTDVGNTFSPVAVSNGDTLSVGFTVEVDGADDGVEVTSVTVDFTAVPEPTTALLSGLSLLALLRRRRA
jgi:hypothetical protein